MFPRWPRQSEQHDMIIQRKRRPGPEGGVADKVPTPYLLALYIQKNAEAKASPGRPPAFPDSTYKMRRSVTAPDHPPRVIRTRFDSHARHAPNRRAIAMVEEIGVEALS